LAAQFRQAVFGRHAGFRSRPGRAARARTRPATAIIGGGGSARPSRRCRLRYC
jgi:hypothetical protein